MKFMKKVFVVLVLFLSLNCVAVAYEPPYYYELWDSTGQWFDGTDQAHRDCEAYVIENYAVGSLGDVMNPDPIGPGCLAFCRVMYGTQIFLCHMI